MELGVPIFPMYIYICIYIFPINRGTKELPRVSQASTREVELLYGKSTRFSGKISSISVVDLSMMCIFTRVYCMYPLVNVYITMDNHYFEWNINCTWP